MHMFCHNGTRRYFKFMLLPKVNVAFALSLTLNPKNTETNHRIVNNLDRVEYACFFPHRLLKMHRLRLFKYWFSPSLQLCFYAANLRFRPFVTRETKECEKVVILFLVASFCLYFILYLSICISSYMMERYFYGNFSYKTNTFARTGLSSSLTQLQSLPRMCALFCTACWASAKHLVAQLPKNSRMDIIHTLRFSKAHSSPCSSDLDPEWHVLFNREMNARFGVACVWWRKSW